jgi:MinD-like ATPase involved in chromosome partitioning or flagellar assembly
VSTQTDEPTIELQLAYPDGQLRLRAPSDIPLRELLAEFVEVCEQPDSDDWTLSADGTNPYPTGRSLDELGVSDGAHLVLAPHPQTERPTQPDLDAMHDARGEGWQGSERAATMELIPREAAAAHTNLTGRPRWRENRQPLADKNARTLPKRLSRPQRITETLRFIGTPQDQPARPVSTDAPGPAHFTRRTRISPVARLRAAWLDTEYQYRLEDRILEMRLRRCATIAVLSPKGGVGKTTTTALIGSMLAYLRRDRVVAVDTNSDWGSLGRKLVPDHLVFIDDLLNGPLGAGQMTPTQLDSALGRGPDGLMVAPAPTDQQRAANLDENAYATLFGRLQQLVGTLVLDCGTGLESAPAKAALGCADQLVVVCDDEPDSASLVSEAAVTELESLTTPMVVVVNNLKRSSRIDTHALECEIPFAAGIAMIPNDEPAAASLQASRLSWRRAPAAWQLPISELVALLVSDWRRLEVAH